MMNVLLIELSEIKYGFKDLKKKHPKTILRMSRLLFLKIIFCYEK